MLQDFAAEIVLDAFRRPNCGRWSHPVHRAVEPGAIKCSWLAHLAGTAELVGMVGGEHVPPDTRHRLDDQAAKT